MEVGFNMDRKGSFLREYLGDFKPSKHSTRLFNIAQEYHRRCDEYDRFACWRRDICGKPIPIMPGEFVAINKHAISVYRELIGRNQDISPLEIVRAIRDYRK
jgi:hypothetical protein